MFCGEEFEGKKMVQEHPECPEADVTVYKIKLFNRDTDAPGSPSESSGLHSSIGIVLVFAVLPIV